MNKCDLPRAPSVLHAAKREQYASAAHERVASKARGANSLHRSQDSLSLVRTSSSLILTGLKTSIRAESRVAWWRVRSHQ